MTVEQQILRLLRGTSYPLTDSEIAKKIKRPLPSVRRTRLKLYDYFQIERYGKNPMRWRA